MPFHQGYVQQGYGPRGPRGQRHEDPSSNPEHEQFRKLFIGGLSYETDEAHLKSHFSKYGEITDCIVMKDSQTKRSRGFGFITFKEAAFLDAAQKGRPHKIDGREVETKRAMPRDQQDPQINQQLVDKMFVGGLKDDTTEDMIRETFPGEIKMIEMITDKATGKSRGFCFVTFDDYDTVDKHVLKKHFDLNGRRVEVKKAMSKNDMNSMGGSRGGFGRGDMGGPYNPGFGMGGGGYGYPGPGRGGYGGGNYGGHGGYGGQGGYGNQGWNQGGYDYGYGNQGGWGGGPGYNNYSGPGHMKGGAGGYGGNYGGSNYNRR